jgi:hypothetical protein
MNAHVQVRFTPAEKARFKAAAKSRMQKMSEVLRALALWYASHVESGGASEPLDVRSGVHVTTIQDRKKRESR